MSFLTRLFGSKKAAHVAAAPAGPCPHTQLVPHWANAEDMGSAEKTSEFLCDACGDKFTPEQGRAMRLA
jgi:hypothetical protein